MSFIPSSQLFEGPNDLPSKWLLLLLGSHQFFEELLIEKGALEEFSDRMSIISLMARGTTFKRQEQLLPWEYDLQVVALHSI